jgi:hypothetical protein
MGDQADLVRRLADPVSGLGDHSSRHSRKCDTDQPAQEGEDGRHPVQRLSRVVQSIPASVRGSPNRDITLASKPVTAVMRSPTIVTTSRVYPR